MTVQLNTNLEADPGTENEYILWCIHTKNMEKALEGKPIIGKMSLGSLCGTRLRISISFNLSCHCDIRAYWNACCRHQGCSAAANQLCYTARRVIAACGFKTFLFCHMLLNFDNASLLPFCFN